MDTQQFYQQLLGLEAPWEVINVDLKLEDQRVDIEMLYNSKSVTCRCNKQCGIYDHSPRRSWRHLDTCQLVTYIHCRVPRSSCKTCKVKMIETPWAEPHGHFTALFEQCAIDWLVLSQKQSLVAEKMQLSFDELHGIMKRAVRRGLNKRKLENITSLSIDEKSMKKGHHYLTVLSDPKAGFILDVCEHRTEEAVNSMFENTLTKEQRDKIESVSMDMWKAFMSSANKKLKNADIVHDRFHISGYLLKAIDQVRRQENTRLSKEGDESLKKSKYLFLRNESTIREKDKERFKKAIEASEKAAKVWKCKEVFRDFFELNFLQEGQNFINNWYIWAINEEITPLTKVANTIKNHTEGILNYIKHRCTNAFAESINGRIQELKVNARGFRHFDNYRSNILFYFGGLDLTLTPLKSL